MRIFFRDKIGATKYFCFPINACCPERSLISSYLQCAILNWTIIGAAHKRACLYYSSACGELAAVDLPLRDNDTGIVAYSRILFSRCSRPYGTGGHFHTKCGRQRQRFAPTNATPSFRSRNADGPAQQPSRIVKTVSRTAMETCRHQQAAILSSARHAADHRRHVTSSPLRVLPPATNGSPKALRHARTIASSCSSRHVTRSPLSQTDRSSPRMRRVDSRLDDDEFTARCRFFAVLPLSSTFGRIFASYYLPRPAITALVVTPRYPSPPTVDHQPLTTISPAFVGEVMPAFHSHVAEVVWPSNSALPAAIAAHNDTADHDKLKPPAC
ncbi:hypothetical protein WI665_12755 [Vibrio cholerae]